jgi:putative ABC transport system ATP-binding protein
LLVTHEADIARYASRVITVKDGLVRLDRRQQPVAAVSIPAEEEVVSA